MDFNEATDLLCQRIDLRDVARALGVSPSTARQMRMRVDLAGHRSPPAAWRRALAVLAHERARHFQALAFQLSLEGACQKKRDGPA